MRMSNRVVPGFVGGLVGSLCCMIGAVAVGLGLAGVGFAAALMARYQLWFIAASLLLMASWMAWTLRRRRVSVGASGWGRGDVATVGRTLVPQMAVMGGVYAVTLLVTGMLSNLVVRG
ncbi:MAG TPA: hypothetical protein VLW53_18005 [Candidatus Eisenbacteria bacterium]|nr:hypothetical protein [Candidatus Eisenbacteria bacterium]